MSAPELMLDVDARLSTPLRIASVPADHVYVRHLARPDPFGGGACESDPVRRLPDPTRPWWPPTMLEPDWVREHAEDFDVFHLHFGFDACSPDVLGELVTVLRQLGKPLVQTVHDLRNPHHETAAAHDEHLDILIPAADALFTLTSGAAAEIQRRWDRNARVVAHPHVLDLAAFRSRESRAARPAQIGTGNEYEHPYEQPFLVGLHLKSMRPCMSGAPIIAALMDTVQEMGQARLRIDVHRDVADPGGARHDAELVEALRLAAEGGAQVEIHDFFSDEELWTYLSDLDVSVLPYRYGTHSGWLEACRDLGTAVVAPTCGYYAEQGPVHSFDLDESGLDAGSLSRAVVAAREAGRPGPLTAAKRTAQRHHIAAVHEQIYREVLR